MSKERLRRAISEVYQRHAEGALRPSDLVTLRDISVESAPGWMTSSFESNRIIDEDAVVFRRFRRDMGIIVEGGAHWGYMALSMRRAGTDCRILSFEALEAHRPCLEELKRLDKDNYDYLITAASDSARVLTLYGPVINGTAVTGLNCVDGRIFLDWHMDYLVTLLGTVIPPAEHYRFQLLETKMTCRPLDDILSADKFVFATDRVAALKIVVEGHEAAVLRGAIQTIRRDKPFILSEAGNNYPDVAALMQDLGYFCADRHDDRIVPIDGLTSGHRGYWFHPQRREQYRAMGFMD
jgi:FkbM family methyltransferase